MFWPEATADYDEQMYVGSGYGFVDFVMEAHLNCVAHSHQFTNILITVDGDTARSETYGDVTLRMIRDDGTPVDSRNLGRYVDWWERREGAWRIIQRRYLHDFDQSGPNHGDFATSGERDRQDASYFGEKCRIGEVRAAPPEPGISGSYIAGNIPECWYQRGGRAWPTASGGGSVRRAPRPRSAPPRGRQHTSDR